ncbi:MAG: hypothetical protein NTW96_08790, partial [Planctomycetia bacterium]|nr:hypothetical protein [Planctomycetia bacterium]
HEYDYADGRNPMDYVGPVLEAVERWRELAGTVTLRMADRPEGVLILHDTRPGTTLFQRRLVGIERAVYHFCDTARSLAAILRFIAEHPDGKAIDPAALRPTLDEWVAVRIMARLDGRYVSLALPVVEKGDKSNY